MATINIGEISDEVRNALEQTRREIIAITDTACEGTCREVVKWLKENSPEKTGEYAKGWKFKRERGKYIIYQKEKPSLTHLLEHGHVTPNGGRTRKKKHIEPATEIARGVLMRRMLEELNR